jgi:di/tricarboxylate transporter
VCCYRSYLPGLLPINQAFEGFGSDTVIMILGLLILTATSRRTGVVELTGNAVLRRAGDEPNRLLFIVMTVSAGLGVFISNTASTAFFVPIVTLVSTSTNMVVSGMMLKYGMSPMGMFELAPVGIPIAMAGLWRSRPLLRPGSIRARSR